MSMIKSQKGWPLVPQIPQIIPYSLSSDHIELIELKGLDEHEACKEANRQTLSRDYGVIHVSERESMVSVRCPRKMLVDSHPVPNKASISSNSTEDEYKKLDSPDIVEKHTPQSPLKEQFILHRWFYM